MLMVGGGRESLELIIRKDARGGAYTLVECTAFEGACRPGSVEDFSDLVEDSTDFVWPLFCAAVNSFVP